MMSLRTVYIFIISIFVLNTEADVAEMKFNLSIRDKMLKCHQNVSNLHIEEVTVTVGEPLKISVDYRYYINYIQCTDFFDSSRVFVWNPTKVPKVPLTVPRVTMEMDGIWSCNIFTHKDVKWFTYPVALYNGSYYAAAYCAIKLYVLPANRQQIYLDPISPEEFSIYDAK